MKHNINPDFVHGSKSLYKISSDVDLIVDQAYTNPFTAITYTLATLRIRINGKLETIAEFASYYENKGDFAMISCSTNKLLWGWITTATKWVFDTDNNTTISFKQMVDILNKDEEKEAEIYRNKDKEFEAEYAEIRKGLLFDDSSPMLYSASESQKIAEKENKRKVFGGQSTSDIPSVIGNVSPAYSALMEKKLKENGAKRKFMKVS